VGLIVDQVRSDSGNFDLLKSALEKTNLIEASAGTGKTYAIAGIFLRLLLENSLSVSEILVVTYTVAATEELRDRIRKTIRATIDAFTKGGHEDPFLDGLVRKYWIPDQDPQDKELPGFRIRPALECPYRGSGMTEGGDEMLRVLRAALRDFDEAPIYTIHGFCQRVLHENAFESMGLFDTELVPDERALHSEIVRDFWRKHFYNAPPELVSYALKKNVNPQFFLALTKVIFSNPDMQVIPAASPVPLTALPSFRSVRERALTVWKSAREEVLSLLKSPGLSKSLYKNPDVLAARMDGYADSEETFPLFEGFEKFTASGLKAGTKKGASTPVHPFFDDCEEFMVRARELEAEIEEHLLFLKTDIFRYLREELRKRKQARNIQFYDDLLLNLKEALERSGRKGLILKIKGRFRAALIDEFQDTDPIQYAIFHTIFGGGETPLFFIGDPKQSIYSFRGADLFAYMRASHHVDYRYTLRSNWRSEPDLVHAVNAIFANPKKDTFLYEEVPFERAAPGDVKNRSLLTVNGHTEPPFHFWFLGSARLEAAGAKTNRSMTSALIVRAVADEIARLMTLGRERKALIGTEPLTESHIAVLVRENREARLVQNALRDARIHSVVHSTGYLFDTHEALEMERVLAAVAEPHSEGLIRIALTTDILGLNGETLESFGRSESDWEKWLTRFRDYNTLWERHGFIRMFRHFLAREKVRERLLALPDGERRLTNILHLMEVLHTESIERKPGISGTVKWLSCQRDPDALRREEHELRLESDDRAVRIVTIHKSKGLEYPVVFCPFNWGHSKTRKKEFTYHNPEDDWRLNLVLDPDAVSGKTLAERENLAENIRLLYVSVTRAKNRCYLVWGPFKDAGSSSLAYVLHPPHGNSPSVVGATEENFLTLRDEDIAGDLARIAAKSKGAVSFYDMPDPMGKTLSPAAEPAGTLTCRTFSEIVDRDRRIGSFSYLRSEHMALPEFAPDDLSDLPDRDGATVVTEMFYQKEPAGMFAFPKGAKAGNCLHDILEHVDFTAPDSPETKNLVAIKLREHGFDPKWQEAVCRMIDAMVTTPLDPAIHGLALSSISFENRLSEIEFTFPLHRLTPDALRNIFKKSGIWSSAAFPEKIGKLTFQPVRGYMKGFMDLVFLYEGRFFLVDWKSNFLGASLEDYGTEALAEVMREELYLLQYHLYIVALHQYLKMRLSDYDYKTHFGGVMYIFLRGVNPETGSHAGIYRDRPAKKAIEFLCKNLIAI
jgi:exodeoxyribonuclease V beta subunit